MYCWNCGMKNTDDACFCSSCGEKLDNAVQNRDEQIYDISSSQSGNLMPATDKKSKKAPVVVSIIALIAISAGVCFWYTTYRNIDIDLSSGYKTAITVSGNDGEGKINIDQYEIKTILADGNGRLKKFLSQVNFAADKTSGLSNGEHVKIKAKYVSTLEQKYHVTVTGNTMDYLVRALDEADKEAEQPTEDNNHSGNAFDYDIERGTDSFDTKLLTADDLRGRTDAELQAALNYICAKNGRIFKNIDYSRYKWYLPIYSASDFDNNIKTILSPTAYENYRLILRNRDVN